MHEETPESPPDAGDLLEQVARVAREDEMADAERLERLRRLAEGSLPEADLEALRAEARSSPETAADLAAFEPLDRAFHDRVVERLQTRPAKRAPGEVVAMPRRRWRPRPSSWLALAAVLAVAVLGTWLYRPFQRPVFDSTTYTPELTGGIRTERGGDEAPAEAQEFGPGSHFRLVLRPDAKAVRRPEVALYLLRDDGTMLDFDDYEITGRGVVRIDGIVGEDLRFEPGDWTLVFVYGEPGHLPKPNSPADLDTLSSHWRAIPVHFRVLAGTSASAEASADESAEVPLQVLYAGCYLVSLDEAGGDPTCVPYPEIRLWLRSAPDAEIEVRLAGERLELAGVLLNGGLRFVIPVSAADGTIEVLAQSRGQPSSARIRLAPNPEPAWLVEARRTAYGGDGDKARATLAAHLEAAPDEVLGLAAGLAARLSDNDRDRERWLLQSIELNRRSGHILRRFQDLEVLLHGYVDQGRYGEIRGLLAEIGEPASSWPAEAWILIPLFSGLVESKVGNFRAALPAQRQASDLARRVGLARYLGGTESRLAETLQLLGRGKEAEVLLERTTTAPDFADFSPCFRAQILTTHGWIRLMDEHDLGAALPKFEQAASLISTGDCDLDLELNLGLDRAMALERLGQTYEARRLLADLEPARPTVGALYLLWWHDLEGRLALDEGDPEGALESFRDMEALADLAFEPRAHWRAKVQIAETLELLGRNPAALAAYSEAERLVDERNLEVPLDAGRERFLADRESGSRRYIELLLRLGRVEKAFEVARRSRSRVLRSIYRGHRLAHLGAEEQAAWDLAVARYLDLRRSIEFAAAEDSSHTRQGQDQLRARLNEQRQQALRALDQTFRVLGTTPSDLPELRAGELVLAYHPLTTGWVGFAARPEGVEYALIDQPDFRDAAQVADLLLAPFQRRIDEARSLRVLAYGPLQSLDFHALPWHGSVLLASKPVVYGLDLEAGHDRAPSAAGRRALVVGDPRNDLPAARHESEVVAAALANRHDVVEVAHLEGSAATAEAIRRDLPRVDLFHLAGHSAFDGPLGWESGLNLADDRQLTLGDILALERAPAQVVLSSCDSARSSAGSPAGLGLAQAFLITGSHQVLAATRPIGDREAEALFGRLYAEGSDLGDLAQELRSAQLDWFGQDPAADWAGFRILEP